MNKNELRAACARATATLVPIAHDCENTHLKSRYTSLDAVYGAIKPALKAEGLILSQEVTFDPKDNVVVVYTTVTDFKDGESHEFKPTICPTSKLDAQGFGSGASYGKRYALNAIFCIEAGDDDDGAGASQGTRPVKPIEGAKSAHTGPEPTKGTRKLTAADTDPDLDW